MDDTWVWYATITGVAEGMATITVTATDMADATATQDIMVTVEAADTTPMAPTSVMATADDSDPGDLMITVTDGRWRMAGGVCVVLFKPVEPQSHRPGHER